MTFTVMFVHIMLVRVSLLSGHLLGKKLLTRLTKCSLCILTICNLVASRFAFMGRHWVLIAPAPAHCILVTVIAL